MGFWQHLAESYDKNADALKKTYPPYPLSTTSISNNADMIVVIVIDGKGEFQKEESYAAKIEKVKRDNKTGGYIAPPVFLLFLLQRRV